MKPKYLILSFLGLLFITSRFINLMKLPMFLDEAIYFRWLETIKTDPSQWLLPLKEFGWMPLTTWIATLFSFLVKDSLLALRLTSVLFGGLSLFVAYKLTRIFCSYKAACLTIFLVMTSPAVLIHDRLGLRGDTAVTFFSLLVFYGLGQRLINKKTKASLTVGISLALALITKSTAWTLPLSVFLAFLVFRPKLTKLDLFNLAPSAFVGLFFLATGSFSSILNKSSVFLLSFSQAAKLFKPNLIQLVKWGFEYLTWPIMILTIIGGYVALKTKHKFCQLLSLMTWPAILMVLFFAKIFFPRYLLATTVISLMAAVCALAFIIKKLPSYFLIPLFLVVFLPSIFINKDIVFNFKKAELPEIEKWQYISGWPSGYAVQDLVNHLNADPPDILISESNDLVLSSLNYYWPEHQINQLQLDEAYILNTPLPENQKTYLVLNEAPSLPEHFTGELIKSFSRPENKSSIRLYEIN